MELPKELTTVTNTSKILAGIVFMTLPFIAFFIGTTYQALVTPKSTDTNIVSTPKVSTSSATSDWETYTSTKYGFSFMYPSGYSNDCCGIEGPASGSPENIIALADPTTAEGTSVPFNGFAVYVEPNNDGKTFESYVSEQKQAFLKKYKDDSGKEAQNLSEKSVNVGGEAGITLIGYIDWAKEIIFIPFPDEQKVLAIVMLEKSKGSFEAIFNQILSTFKFTDQSQTDSTADWKTYTSEEYGYSVKYPTEVTHKQLVAQTVYNKTTDVFKINGGELAISGVCGRDMYPIKSYEITIAGQQTTKAYETELKGSISAISRPNSSEFICFSFSGLPNDLELRQKTDQLFDQILSTFKFVTNSTENSNVGSEEIAQPIDPGKVNVISTVLPFAMRGLSCENSDSTNKIYCFGGESSNGAGGGLLSNKILEYSPSSKSVVVKNVTLPTNLTNTSCANSSKTNNIYCFGGFGTKPINQIVEYSPAQDSVSIKNAVLPTGRFGHSCVEDSRSQKILCFGGFGYITESQLGYISQIVEYDPTSDTARVQNNSLPDQAAKRFVSCSENSKTNKIYCLTGDNAGGASLVPYEFDLAQAAGALATSMIPSERIRAACSENPKTGKIYCFGGWNSNKSNYLDEIIEYDTVSERINKLGSSLPIGRSEFSCTTNPSVGKAYCFGGSGSDTKFFDQILEYTFPE